MTPYGSHAKMSNTGFVMFVRISLMLAPYSTVSRVGRTDTQICGRIDIGMNLALQKRSNHENIGVAGRTNCPVKGMRRPRVYEVTMKSFPSSPGDSQVYKQARATIPRKRYCPSPCHVKG